MRAAIYTRVSTPGQAEEGESLEMQKERLVSYAKAQGWKVVKVYEDGGYSGGTTKRPGFQQMVADARLKKFDVLLVYKIDRLSRSILDFHTTMKMLQDSGVSFVSLTQNFGTSTSMGRLMLAILVDFANFEREINIDRARDSYLNRLSHGYHSGRTPFGYVRKEGNILVKNAEQAQVVKEIFSLAYQGISTRTIAEKFHMTRDRVKSILDNPVYTGYVSPRSDKHGHRVKDPSQWVKGNHEAIVSLDYYLAVQKVWRKGPKKTKYIGLFQKLIYCPYDKHNFTLEARKDKKYIYYACMPIRDGEKTCGRRFSEIFIEQLLLHLIKRSRLFNMYKAKVREDKSSIEEEVKKIDKKIDRYLDLLEYQDVPVLKIKEKLKELQDKKKRIINSVKPVKNAELLKYIKTVNEVYPYMTRAEKQRLWHLLIKRITLYADSFKIDWKNDIQTQGSLKTISRFGGDEGI